MSLELLQTLWFLLLGVLLVGYAILDGFDLGVGFLHLFARSDEERRLHMNAIGPVWDGNEVWLLTAGGAMFAAFPPVYATVFSAHYLAIMLLLLALIARAVSMEFRSKLESPRWRRVWDFSFGLGSTTAGLLFGVALGNILRGLPIDEQGLFQGNFLTLLSPYALLVGFTGLGFFVMHGAIWMALKTDGELQHRMVASAMRAWVVFLALYIGATAYSYVVAPHLFDGLLSNLTFWPAFSALIAAVLAIPCFLYKVRLRAAFLASATIVAALLALVGISLFPNLVPSSLDPAYSLTVHNSSSSAYTLNVMFVIALIGMPLVIVYTVFIYRRFGGKVVLHEDSY